MKNCKLERNRRLYIYSVCVSVCVCMYKCMYPKTYKCSKIPNNPTDVSQVIFLYQSWSNNSQSGEKFLCSCPISSGEKKGRERMQYMLTKYMIMEEMRN